MVWALYSVEVVKWWAYILRRGMHLHALSQCLKSPLPKITYLSWAALQRNNRQTATQNALFYLDKVLDIA